MSSEIGLQNRQQSWALIGLYAWSFLSFVVMSGGHPLALFTLLLSLPVYWKRHVFPLSRRNAAIGIALALTLALIVSQTADRGGYLLGAGSLAFAVFAALAVLVFTLLRYTENTKMALPALCGLLLVACSMSTEIRMVAAFGVIGMVLFGLAMRERQGLAFNGSLVLPLIVVVALTGALALAAAWSETRLSYLLNLFSVIPASGIRFPPSSSLNSIQRWSASDVVVLRAYGESAPPYLIGRTFLSYDDNSFWHWKPTKEEIRSVTTLPQPGTGTPLPFYPNQTGQAPGNQGPPVSIEFPDGGSGFTFYAPRYFSGLTTDLPQLHRYNDGLWQVLARDTFSGSYHLYPYANGWKPQNPALALTPEERSTALELPTHLTPEVARLAQEVAGQYRDPEEKARRIVSYFQTQFEYGYDYPFQSPATALEEFLLKRPPVHCEFFATSAALMLRAQGVPTRYINGFVIQEKSLDGDYYVIRLKHAHAWIEAYLPKQGWVTFDPTPPGVLESPEKKSNYLAGTLEWLANKWRQLLGFFRLSPSTMLQTLRDFLAVRSVGDWLGIAGLLAAAWTFRYWWARRSRKTAIVPGEAAYEVGRDGQLTPWLEALQEAIQPPVWRRQPWETPYQWLERLGQADIDPETLKATGRLIERYQSARYGGECEPTVLRELQAGLLGLSQEFEGKSLEARERPPHHAP